MLLFCDNCTPAFTLCKPRHVGFKKIFDLKPYDGEIVSYDLGERFYLVKYEDGDSEEMDEEQITEHLHPSERATKRNAQEEAMVRAAIMRSSNGKRTSKLARAMKVAAFAGLSAVVPSVQRFSSN